MLIREGIPAIQRLRNYRRNPGCGKRGKTASHAGEEGLPGRLESGDPQRGQGGWPQGLWRKGHSEVAGI